MSNKEKQIKNASLYMLPVIIGNILPLITLPIFTRILSPVDYGVFALAQVYAIFVNGVANFGLTTGYERNFFENKNPRNQAGLLYSTVCFVLATFIFFGLLTYYFQDKLAGWIIRDSKHGDVLFLSYCAVGVTSLKTYFLTYFKNKENAKSFVWYSIDESILSVVFSLIMVWYMGMGIFGLVLGQLIAGILIFGALSFKFLKTLPFFLDANALQNSLKLSVPLTPRIFFGVIGTQFDKYMIGLLSTLGGVGIYNLGQKMGNIVFTFMTAVQNVYSPQVYKKMFELDEETGGEAIGKYLTPFIYISISGGLFVALFAEELITILTPEAYHGAIDIIMILSLLYGTYFFGKQPQLIFAKKTSITSALTLVGIVLNVIINIPFIYKFGVLGAAWGTLLAGLISGTISFKISQRYYYIKWEYKKVASIFLIFFGFTLVELTLRSFDVSYPIRLFGKLIAVLSFIYLGSLLNIINKQNLALIKNLLLPARK